MNIRQIMSAVVLLLVANIILGCSGGQVLSNNNPSIIYTIPSNGATGVGIESEILITVSESVNNNFIHLYARSPQSQNIVFTNITYTGNNTYKITPLQPLSYATTYYISISQSLTTQNELSLQSQQLISFTTEDLPLGDIWMGGTNLLNSVGIYGEINILSATSQPGSRELGASWTDKNGNLWLFGGVSNDVDRLNDLWRYNPYSKVWTWIKGSNLSNQSGIYGFKGISSNLSTPGARSGAMYWTDKNGNLWLFGGYGYDETGNLGYLSDMWLFNPSNLTWTWMTGNKMVDESGYYGNKGVSSLANLPGARDRGNTWVDSSGNLWLFGGCVVTSPNTCSYINDLWKYNTQLIPNQWVWVGGSNTIGEVSNYGIQGEESSGNIPGARDASVTWIDKNGNLWLFGGYNQNGAWNDLWKYNLTTEMWSWVSGPNVFDQPSIYGTKNVESATNIPGSREDSISWVDNYGNFWLLGGSGRDVNGNTGQLNDLWRYNPATNSWMWVSGFRFFGLASNYGQIGISGGGGVVVSAREGAIAWTDLAGNFWLFGGYGVTTQSNTSVCTPSVCGYLDDLWIINTQN